MPGFALEEPFPLARFQNSIGSAHLSKHFVVGLTKLETAAIPSAESEADNLVESDHIAITVQGEGVKLYSTSDQKCLKSWTTPPGIVFAEPATHRAGGRDADSLDYTYALVAAGPDVTKDEENKIVWMWKDTHGGEDGDSSKISKKFETRIQSIHISPTMTSNVILVNENGSINIYSKDLDRLTATHKESSEARVVWSNVFVTSSAHVRPCCIPNTMVPALSTVVMTVSNIEGSDIYTVRTYYMNEERRSVDLLAKIDMKHAETPVGFTFDSVDGRMTTLGSAGTWAVWRMYMKHGSANKIAVHLTKHLSVQLQGYRFYDETLGAVSAVTPLSDSYVAMVASRIKKNAEPEHVVSVWDVKYGTLQAEQVLKVTEKSISSKDKCVYNISVLSNSHLAITISTVDIKTSKSGKSQKSVTNAKSVVMICPYYCEPMSLMAAMGKMRSTVEFLGAQQDTAGLMRSGMDAVGQSVFPNRQKGDAEFYRKWVTKQESVQAEEDLAMKSIFGEDLNQDEFTKAFMAYVFPDQMEEDTLIDTKTILAQTKAYRKIMAPYLARDTRPKSESRELSHRLVSSVVNKCFSKDEEFWPIKVILFLLAKRRIRSHLVKGGLISALIERKKWALIPIVLEQVKDIPETDLVVLIKALIKNTEEEPAIWKPLFSRYVKMIIDSPRNDIFMQQALKQLTPTELPFILDLLLIWLEKDSQPLTEQQEAIYARNPVSLAVETPLHNNTLEITSAILDTHFPTVILETSLYETVQKLAAIVKVEVDLADQLEQLRGVLGPFTRKHKHKAARRAEKKDEIEDESMDDALARSRKAHKGGRFGGEQGIPVYRVESFRF
ncbi:hypothetical protein J3Q64DRAFT_1666935 [Phycomyces blakesleeanus]|uniref:Uncharacterized protein n=2 Tax=Phycomyces blakesleeanus TaxID=4837 RepID=A0A163B987_PHYB8|nr:hypothetical protein PHYBLDRAFT_140978 [Phycomyces blakesleeanus NRRL 1555(-)]OAD78921.1 hypothetical protein PHYBLDRAFT_140978 [Phycomyces blakesleeanus NRRL 1555(-)]|eukprot:XP_018296961.1 hypothetical protein PHYBLDRAFT_140978 [Phycomyces blakesleeanus NRRL 1555(-)]